MTRLLLDVSGHGYGHLAQSAPAVNALAERRPDLDLTVRTDLPPHLLRERLAVPFRHLASRPDPGLAMNDALSVDRAASMARYRAFHRDWDGAVAAEAAWQEQEGFDLILADVAYRSLAGAARAGLPAAALCSLDWASVFRHYLADRAGAGRIHHQILAAYRQARLFLQPVPHMPMEDLANRRQVGPIAPPPKSDPAALKRRLAGHRRLGVVSLGGIPFPLDPGRWPADPDTLWVVSGAAADRADQRDPGDLAMPPLELLAAADTVVTKPGYATFVEAACQGVDVLYLPRGDWPEEPYLIDWIRHNARAARLSREELTDGGFIDRARAMLPRSRPPRPACTGAAEAAAALAALLV